MNRSVPLHEDRIVRDTRRQFLEFLGPDEEARRVSEIEALPTVEWKGRTLRTIRCHGTRGKGPHDMNVPESVLWALMSLQAFCCAYHYGDEQG